MPLVAGIRSVHAAFYRPCAGYADALLLAGKDFNIFDVGAQYGNGG